MTNTTSTTEPASAIVEADEPEVSREQADHHSAACCTDDQPNATAALDDIKTHEIAPEVAALRATGFKQLLDQGLPVELHEWAHEGTDGRIPPFPSGSGRHTWSGCTDRVTP